MMKKVWLMLVLCSLMVAVGCSNSGIATNINQMAKHCNETGWFGSTDARRMKEALDAVLELLKELIERWR